jgi:hypothetical protein
MITGKATPASAGAAESAQRLIENLSGAFPRSARDAGPIRQRTNLPGLSPKKLSLFGRAWDARGPNRDRGAFPRSARDAAL